MGTYGRSNTNALDAANYILALATRDGVPIDPLKLQKVLFYCQCWSLLDGGKLFDDEVEAWKHGPVVRNVWKAYSGGSNIRVPDELYYELTADQIEMIEGVWECLKGLPGTVLSKRTHQSESAWRKARGGLPDTADSDRPLDLKHMADDAEAIRSRAESGLLAVWEQVLKGQD